MSEKSKLHCENHGSFIQIFEEGCFDKPVNPRTVLKFQVFEEEYAKIANTYIRVIKKAIVHELHDREFDFIDQNGLPKT